MATMARPERLEHKVLQARTERLEQTATMARLAQPDHKVSPARTEPLALKELPVLMARRVQPAPVENKESRGQPGLLAQPGLPERRVLLELQGWLVLTG
jgi:hypothetical protein